MSRSKGVGRLKAVWSELVGLFVDDGRLALAVLIWLGLCRLALPHLTPPHLSLPPALPPVILFAGLAAILAESALRRARRK